MKYIVTVNDERIEIERDADGLRLGDRLVHAHLSDVQGTPVKVLRVGDAVHRIVMERGEARGQYVLWIDGYRYDVEALDERTRAIRELSRQAAKAAGPAPLVAPMPGLVVRVNVTVGGTVQPGHSMIVMEAMKMENELRARSAGTVSAVRVAPGAAVEKGAVLVELT